MAKGNGRDTKGRFAEGNRFGTGRPKRPVELEYLRALSDAVSLDTWREIVGRAVEDAKNGDKDARGWLAKYLIGESATLTTLAKFEALNITPADYARAQADLELNPGGLESLLHYEREGESVISRAVKFAQETTSHGNNRPADAGD